MGFLDKHIPTLEGKDAERFVEMAKQNEEGANKIDFSEQIKAFEKIMKNSSLYNKKDFVKEPANMIEGLADVEPQDKMVSLNKVKEWLKNNMKVKTTSYSDVWDNSEIDQVVSDFYTIEEMINSFCKAMEE